MNPAKNAQEKPSNTKLPLICEHYLCGETLNSEAHRIAHEAERHQPFITVEFDSGGNSFLLTKINLCSSDKISLPRNDVTGYVHCVFDICTEAYSGAFEFKRHFASHEFEDCHVKYLLKHFPYREIPPKGKEIEVIDLTVCW